MKEEVRAACEFWANFFVDYVDEDKMNKFRSTLVERLEQRYSDHWYEDLPCKGSGYRSMNVDRYGIDPVIIQSAGEIGLLKEEVKSLLPGNCVLYCNPGNVRARVHSSRHPEVLYLYNGRSRY